MSNETTRDDLSERIVDALVDAYIIESPSHANKANEIIAKMLTPPWTLRNSAEFESVIETAKEGNEWWICWQLGITGQRQARRAMWTSTLLVFITESGTRLREDQILAIRPAEPTPELPEGI